MRPHASPDDPPGSPETGDDPGGSESMIRPIRRAGRPRGARPRTTPPSTGGFSLDWPPHRPGRDGYYGSGA